MHPYLWVGEGELEWLTCRWRTEAPVGVAILGTDEAETTVVRQALRAWEGAELGIRFVEVPPGAAQLRLLALDGPIERDDGSAAAGRAIANCRFHPERPAAGERPHAELVSARVEVARAVGPDFRGRMRPLTPTERLGTWVHEIGHALGYSGHWRRGDDPMRLEPDRQRLTGERLMSGKRLSSPALRALYARPSGSVLRRVPVPAERTRDVTTLAGLAARAGLEGPFLRSGDRAARIFWSEVDGREYGVQVFAIARVWKDPKWFQAVPEPATRRELR